MYSEKHFCDCVDDSVWGAGFQMVVVLLLKMMNRVFQFRKYWARVDLRHQCPFLDEILILRPYRGLHLSLHYDENIGNGIMFNLDLTRTYILYDGILRIWPKRSVIGLTQPGMEFRILCLEGSVISPFLTGAYPGGCSGCSSTPLNFQSGYFPTPHLNIYPFPFKGWCMGVWLAPLKSGQWTKCSPCGAKSKIFAKQKIDHSEQLKVGICCDWSSSTCPPLVWDFSNIQSFFRKET